MRRGNLGVGFFYLVGTMVLMLLSDNVAGLESRSSYSPVKGRYAGKTIIEQFSPTYVPPIKELKKRFLFCNNNGIAVTVMIC